MEVMFNTPLGDFCLNRMPKVNDSNLRAWDAADGYVLDYLTEQYSDSLADQRILILNDSFGALTVALNRYRPFSVTDSWLARQAMLNNLADNGLTDHGRISDSLNWPNEVFDLVLLKIPKNLSYLEDQLLRLQDKVTSNTVFIAFAMVKNLPETAWKLIQKYLGTCRPSITRQKARLIFATIDPQRPEFENPFPSSYVLEKTPYRLWHHANVFSRARLDIGTRFLLEHLPKHGGFKDIADLGCGNGVVGIELSEFYPEANIHFIDESYMAVESAKINFTAAFPNRSARFEVTDGLSDYPKNSLDLIVCNPPFHQQQVIGTHIASNLFQQARRCLRSGGEFWVIGNRHLGYHVELKKRFGHCQTVASNAKFVIYRMKT